MEPRGVNPWKLTAIAMALVMATALITGLVVANWSGGAPEPKAAATPAPAAPKPVAQAAVPPPDAIAARNRYAGSRAAPRDKTLEVVKDAAIGAAVGAAVGAAGGAIAGGGTLYGLHDNRKHDERYREAYATCMRGRGYAG
jgi:hypothetical protein